jgi:hypothetical protein
MEVVSDKYVSREVSLYHVKARCFAAPQTTSLFHLEKNDVTR